MYEAGYRHLIKIVFFLLMIPILYVVIKSSVAYVTGPTLYDGDSVESRKCRECKGDGKDTATDGSQPAEINCPACGGKGAVDVVLPGPSRPTRVWGVVVDAQKADETIAFSCPRNIKVLPMQLAFLPADQREIQGSVAAAKLTFEQAGAESLEAQSDATGRFTQRLPPGSYRVKVVAAGFAPFETKLEIQPLTAPIWLERARILRELSEEESRSANGLALVVAITKPDEGGAFVRLYSTPLP